MMGGKSRSRPNILQSNIKENIENSKNNRNFWRDLGQTTQSFPHESNTYTFLEKILSIYKYIKKKEKEKYNFNYLFREKGRFCYWTKKVFNYQENPWKYVFY